MSLISKWGAKKRTGTEKNIVFRVYKIQNNSWVIIIFILNIIS